MIHTLTPEVLADLPQPPVFQRHPTINPHRAAKQLPRPSACANCGTPYTLSEKNEPNVDWHHPDYRYPYACIALCESCHGLTHAGVIAEAVTGRYYPNRYGVTKPEWDAEARAYVAAMTGPVRKPWKTRPLSLHRHAVKMGLLFPIGNGAARWCWPVHLLHLAPKAA